MNTDAMRSAQEEITEYRRQLQARTTELEALKGTKDSLERQRSELEDRHQADIASYQVGRDGAQSQTTLPGWVTLDKSLPLSQQGCGGEDHGPWSQSDIQGVPVCLSSCAAPGKLSASLNLNSLSAVGEKKKKKNARFAEQSEG